ncbi:MAG: DUF4412 domain-containing protein [Deltaproteobacteria bacterium]|nr:DUF4412 domain-containing protein [Deltaproteobacteria bacterium]
MTTAAGIGPDVAARIIRISLGGEITPKIKNVLDAIESLDGYPVLQETVTEAGGQTARTTLTLKKVEKKKIDKALFDVPEGYRKVDPTAMPGRPGAAR